MDPVSLASDPVSPRKTINKDWLDAPEGAQPIRQESPLTPAVNR